MAHLKRISAAWLKQKRSILNATMKEIPNRQWAGETDGETRFEDTDETRSNPAHEKLQRIVEAAELHFQTWERVKEKAANAGYRQNRYAGTCAETREAVPAFAGFVIKVGSTWTTYAADVVIDKLGITIADLPVIEETRR